MDITFSSVILFGLYLLMGFAVYSFIMETVASVVVMLP